jgi:CPA2 family monovalent cation:H+ antiporter-2
LILAAKGIIIIVVVYVLARFLMPKLLYQVARTKSRELFLLSILVICLLVAWITSSIGLSLALGAFLAGLIISESEYSNQAISNIIPFKEIFESFFFVSIGMLLDVSFFLDNLVIIFLITAGVISLKFLISSVAAFILKLPLRTVILVGLALAQVGEFSFILSKIGLQVDLINGELYQYFLSVSILSMSATPFIIKFAHNITYGILKAPLPKYFVNKLTNRIYNDQPGVKKRTFRNHLIVIGYGLNGRNVVKAAQYALIPYVIVEMNADTVKEEKEKGEPIFYGDAVHEEMLKHVSVDKARVVVIAISDLISTRRVVSNIRDISQSVYVIVRTRYIHEIEQLKNLGANVVVAEEFETSIEIFTRVLTKYLMPRNEIENFINVIRSDGYEMLRSLPEKGTIGEKIHDNLSNVDIAAIKLSSHCTMLGKTLAESDVRNKFGITLLAIKRKDEIINNPYGETTLEKDDLLFVFGEPDKIARFNNFMEKK